MTPLIHAARRSRTGLLAAFGAVVVALALVGALVMVAVQPQFESLRDIAYDHARAVQVTTAIRGRISQLRREILEHVRNGTAPPDDLGGEFTLLAADAGVLTGRASTADGRADGDSLDRRLEACAAEGRRLLAAIRRGDVERARERIDHFVELTSAANEAADRVVSFNAVQVEQLSRSIRRNLRWTLLASMAVVLVGGASALFLLRRALRGLDAEEAAASARSTELEVFAARAAHELRTPLQGVSLALSALERGGSTDALARSRRSVERLRETVDGLLDLARAGATAAGPGAADVRQVVIEVRDELAAQLASASMSLDIDVPPGTTVAMAAPHVATVMRNLVTNAVKYASNGQSARVRVSAVRRAAGVHIEVADEGPGILEEALPHVFEPFVRGTSRSTGHGLGLATVKRIVESHRGAVAISSAAGQGTTIVVDLPVAPLAAGTGSLAGATAAVARDR
jgi:signal transduction histidine kinase